MAFTVLSFAASSLLTSTKMTQLYDNTDNNRFATGTEMVFFQAAAPTGWTQNTSNTDKALRIVSGSGGGSGGSALLSSGNVGGHTLVESEIPSHNHTIALYDDPAEVTDRVRKADKNGAADGTTTTGNRGGGGSHDHSLDIAFIDVIIAAKD
jgi:hypothetical protein